MLSELATSPGLLGGASEQPLVVYIHKWRAVIWRVKWPSATATLQKLQ